MRAPITRHQTWQRIRAAGLVAALACLVWFLISQGLDRGDQWASIGSLLLVVGGLVYGEVRKFVGSPSEALHVRPGDDARWIPLDDCGDVSAVADVDELPAWPTKYPGYRRSTPKPTFDHSAPEDRQPIPDKEWVTESATVRVFAGQGPALIDAFPATMNGAWHQRFLIRWRTLDGSDVVMGLVSVADQIRIHPAVYGSAGYVSSNALGQPAWEIVHEDHRLVDVQVAWQRWVPDV